MNRSPQQVLKKMQDLFAQEIEKLSPRIIVPTRTGVTAFGSYSIDFDLDAFTVTKKNGAVKTFAVQSHALAWCIADKFAQVPVRRRIECLGERYYKLSLDLLALRSKYRLTRSRDDKGILEAKLSNCVYELTKVTDQLEKCISQAKYWQQQEFHHEIERSQAPNSPAASSSSHGELFGAWSRIQ